ncbi:MAG: hypothetical protein JO345_16690 [Streptosporangiaceae bacterium]|nr:hypothetical protein [Streptosporangiaceae bacterium]
MDRWSHRLRTAHGLTQGNLAQQLIAVVGSVRREVPDAVELIARTQIATVTPTATSPR